MKYIKQLLIAFNISLLLLQLVTANIRSGDGDQLAGIDREFGELVSQNRQLQETIYTKSSLSTIKINAEGQGLIHLSMTQLTPKSLAQAQQPLP